MGRPSNSTYLPDLKFIFKGLSPYGETIFINTPSRVMTLYAQLEISDIHILTYGDHWEWIPVYIYNKRSIVYDCKKNARYYYDFYTRPIGILNNKYHYIDTLNTNSEFDYSTKCNNEIGRILYYFYYTYKNFEIRYSQKSITSKSLYRKTISLAEDYIANNKLNNRYNIKLFINNKLIDIRKYINLYKWFTNYGIDHDIRLSVIFNSLLFVNISSLIKFDYNSIIYNQLMGYEYNDNFKHFNLFTMNDKEKKYTYYRVAIRDNHKLDNLIVYTNNYLLRLINVRK